MSNAYPIGFDVPYQEEHSRLKALFRWILAIPVAIVLLVYTLIAYIAVLIAWFALLFTGKYPPGLYNLAASVLRMSARINAYASLLTDKYPPFSGSAERGDYPVDVRVGPPQESYNRAKVFFRIILAIPLLILLYLIDIWASLMAFVAWIVEIVTGKLPEGIYRQLVFCLRYQARASGYLTLLTETYPPISEEEGAAQ